MVELQYFLIPFTNWQVMALLWIGVFAGTWVGAIPGLSGTMAVSLLISLTFSWQLNNALALMCGVFVGAVYGGAIAAVLLNIPGAPAAVATSLDGYPLGQKGEAGMTIGLYTVISMFAGLLGVVILLTAAPIISKFALQFAPKDFFLLGCMGILLIGSIGCGEPIKGITAGAVGVLVSLVGMDPYTGEMRYTFDTVELMGGIHFVAAMIGIFGVSEALMQFRSRRLAEGAKQNLDQVIPSWKKVKKYLPLGLRSSVLGIFIGALPGTGGDVAALFAYDQAKRTTKNPEVPFGEGAIEGVIAPEAANKGAIGGAFIPMLTLGIPGDAVTAVIIGALFIHGLKPGPLLVLETPHLFWMIVSMLFIAMIAMCVIGLLSVRPFAKVIEAPKNMIMPLVIVLSVIGTYAIQNSLTDVFAMVAFGIFGYFLRLYAFPTAPLVLGVILGGPILEQNYRRAMQMVNNDLSAFLMSFVTSPLSVCLLILLFLMMLTQTKTYRKLRGFA